MTYIRRIGVDYFEYIVVFDKQVYSNYWILKPDKGKKDLTKLQVDQAAGLAMAGALATVDMHLGAKLDKETEATVSAFEKNRPNS